MATKQAREKTKKKLLSLTKQQKDIIGLKIESLMKKELSYITYMYIKKYKSAVRDTFGWDEDDLKQYIREVFWKGIATYDSNHEKKSKLTTYLSTILYYQMGNLSKRCQNKKNSQTKLYCVDALFDSDETTNNETGEHWLDYKQNFNILMGKLSKVESKVLALHLIQGASIESMQKTLKMERHKIVSLILNLKRKMKKYIGDEV